MFHIIIPKICEFESMAHYRVGGWEAGRDGVGGEGGWVDGKSEAGHTLR